MLNRVMPEVMDAARQLAISPFLHELQQLPGWARGLSRAQMRQLRPDPLNKELGDRDTPGLGKYLKAARGLRNTCSAM